MHAYTSNQVYAEDLERIMGKDSCFNLALRKSNRLITQLYEDRLSTVGLKAGQFSILRATHFQGETTNRDLQEILVINQTTLSRNLKPLLRDEYLKLQADPDDGRIKRISLTSKGKALYAEALPCWEKAQEDIVSKLGEAGAQNILDLTADIVNTLKK